MKLEDIIFDLEQHIQVNGAIEDVFRSMLHRLGEGSLKPTGPMILEPWPGGRWFRDRGNGIGHLWAHVQVIKPPTLLELSGPMFMSYPALNHVEMRLDELEGGTRITLRHRAIGLLEQSHRDNLGTGWGQILDAVCNDFSAAERGHAS